MKVFDSLNRAMTNQVYANDVISNNLANASTGGFKKMLTAMEIRKGAQYPSVTRRIDDSPGQVYETNNPLDMVIDGQGYFTVQSSQGDKYTRDGSFRLNSASELVTQAGNRVLGSRGPIVLKGRNIQVSEDGRIFSDGALVDSLKLAVIPADRLQEEEGSNLLTCPAGSVDRQFKGTVQQHFLEKSNISPLEEMVHLIEMERVFQTLGKIVTTQDELYGKVVALNSRS